MENKFVENAGSDSRSILVVDDDDTLRMRMARAFEKRGYTAWTAGCYDEVRELLDLHVPDRAVLDLKMPGVNGLDTLSYLMEKCPSTEAVILTGYGSISNAVDAIKIGAVNYVTKPANADEVLAAFENRHEDSIGQGEEIHPQSLAAAEWEHIQRVLKDCQG
ncbi:MAG: response regulator, partial [Planctomycetota bacterium]|nr:response regulator [Planctomycetota bacterium]